MKTYRVYTLNGRRFDIQAKSDTHSVYLAVKKTLQMDKTDDVMEVWDRLVRVFCLCDYQSIN